MKILIAAIPLGAMVVIGWMFYGSLNFSEQSLTSAQPPLIGREVPQFSLPALLQQDTTLTQADLPSTGAYLINVWASWCYACRVEHPVLLRASDQGTTVIGLNYRDQPDAARAWLKEHGNPYAFVIADSHGELVLNLGLTGVPETYLVVDNIIRYRRIGVVDERIWNEEILPWLSPPPAAGE